MSHHRGNDLAASDRDANTDAANPPSLPTPTENTDIDDILGDLFVATHGGKTAHDVEDEDKLDAIDFANTAEILKAAIEQKLTDARIDELQNALTLWSVGESKQYMLDQIKALQASKEGK